MDVLNGIYKGTCTLGLYCRRYAFWWSSFTNTFYYAKHRNRTDQEKKERKLENWEKICSTIKLIVFSAVFSFFFFYDLSWKTFGRLCCLRATLQIEYSPGKNLKTYRKLNFERDDAEGTTAVNFKIGRRFWWVEISFRNAFRPLKS